MLKLLRPWAAKAWQERKRKFEAVAHAVVGAQVAAAEEQRRGTARMGGEVAHTRASGLSRTEHRALLPSKWGLSGSPRGPGSWLARGA